MAVYYWLSYLSSPLSMHLLVVWVTIISHSKSQQTSDDQKQSSKSLWYCLLSSYLLCYCDNVMLVMHCNLMSWDNAKLAASKLTHAADDGPVLRVETFLFPFRLTVVTSSQNKWRNLYVYCNNDSNTGAPNIFSITVTRLLVFFCFFFKQRGGKVSVIL